MRSRISFVVALGILVVPTVNANSIIFDSAKAILAQVNALAGNVGAGALDAVEAAVEHVWNSRSEKEHTDRSSIVETGDVHYEKIQLRALKDHSLRISSTASTLCDPDAKQHSGYLDVPDGKHLFFWYFEARDSPADKPLVLWLSGGPGCSSSTTLLFEQGPCSIRYNTSAPTPFPYTEVNPYSWTEHANIIFLDQPTNVGYSYSTDSSAVNTSSVAAKDVYAFLQLFFAKYENLAGKEFHVAAESYGGMYAPNVGKVIHESNNGLMETRAAVQSSDVAIVLSTEQRDMVTDFKHINLKSLILSNGLTEPYTQYASIPDFLCGSPYAPLDPEGPDCKSLRSKVSTCQELIKYCYDSGSKFQCVSAALYCNMELLLPIWDLGLNPYDLRQKCDPEKDGYLCYKQMSWIEEWLNKDEVKKALGVSIEREFENCNVEVNRAFYNQGDSMRNSAALLIPLLNDGVKLLVYAGKADGSCNYMGNFNWMLALDAHPYAEEFRNATTQHWHLPASASKGGKRVRAGEVRAAYGDHVKSGVGSYVFVAVHESGHMVPYDQPEAASDLIGRWLRDESLSA